MYVRMFVERQKHTGTPFLRPVSASKLKKRIALGGCSLQFIVVEGMAPQRCASALPIRLMKEQHTTAAGDGNYYLYTCTLLCDAAVVVVGLAHLRNPTAPRSAKLCMATYMPVATYGWERIRTAPPRSSKSS